MTLTIRTSRAPAIRVAVVDDHRMLVDGIIAHLAARRLGINVVIAESSWHALLSHSELPVDVVVLDLNLDDGISIGTKVRALGAAGMQTIVVSRHADASSVSGALRAGAAGFVPKSDGADELVRAIRAAALGQPYRNSAVDRAMSPTGKQTDPGLGKQELRALVLYASGRSIREVASDMETTEETVKSYIKRARRKYREIGIDLGTKILLRRYSIREGWLTPE